MAQQDFTVGTFVVNLDYTPAVVVGQYLGDPLLRAVNAEGKQVGGQWVANPDRCRRFGTAAEAYAAALAAAKG